MVWFGLAAAGNLDLDDCYKQLLLSFCSVCPTVLTLQVAPLLKQVASATAYVVASLQSNS